MSLLRRNLQGRALGYSGCLRCGDRWNWKTAHDTSYVTHEGASKGCFPLCEECWVGLTPAERMPYYDVLVNGWVERAPYIEVALGYERERERIRAAVMSGG